MACGECVETPCHHSRVRDLIWDALISMESKEREPRERQTADNASVYTL